MNLPFGGEMRLNTAMHYGKQLSHTHTHTHTHTYIQMLPEVIVGERRKGKAFLFYF